MLGLNVGDEGRGCQGLQEHQGAGLCPARSGPGCPGCNREMLSALTAAAGQVPRVPGVGTLPGAPRAGAAVGAGLSQALHCSVPPSPLQLAPYPCLVMPPLSAGFSPYKLGMTAFPPCWCCRKGAVSDGLQSSRPTHTERSCSLCPGVPTPDLRAWHPWRRFQGKSARGFCPWEWVAVSQ